jgi:hypothetical protein
MAGKGLLALLAAPKKGVSEKSGAPAPMGGGGDEVGDALMEMFDALQSGDSSGAALAFKRAYHACADEGSDPLDMGGEDEEESDDGLDL